MPLPKTWPFSTGGAKGFTLLSLPLILHVLPCLIIGYGFVIPGSCIAGVNQYTLGYLSAVLGYIPNYYIGIWLARRLMKAESVG